MSESTQEIKPSSQYDRDSLYYRHERDDEIDLVELFMKIWNRKWWVILAGTLTTGIALAYALLATPVYEIYSYVRPPLTSQLLDLRQDADQVVREIETVEEAIFYSQLSNSSTNRPVNGEEGDYRELSDLSTEDVFFRFLNAVSSYSLQQEVFSKFVASRAEFQNKSEIELDADFEDYISTLTISVPTPKKGEKLTSDTISILIQDSDRALGVDAVNYLIARAQEASRSGLISELEMERQTALKGLNESLDRKVESESKSRINTIAVLKEKQVLELNKMRDLIAVTRNKIELLNKRELAALESAIITAKSLNIIKPTTYLDQNEKLVPGQVSVRNEFGTVEAPLYLRGTELLQAEYDALVRDMKLIEFDPELIQLNTELETLLSNREIEMLELRTDDTLAIWKSLKPIQERINALNQIDSSYRGLDVVRIEKKASVPKSPIKPKKTLIVLLGGVLGGMLGVFIALVVPARKETVPA